MGRREQWHCSPVCLSVIPSVSDSVCAYREQDVVSLLLPAASLQKSGQVV